MIQVTNISVYNFENAIRGMRNPLNSWDKSDSYVSTSKENGYFILGETDKDLALRLIRAGSDHSKFMRQILISMDINAPLYWWKEMDTYKVATVANSTSTMHKLGSRLLTPEDFSWDYVTEHRQNTLSHLNNLIGLFQKSKCKTAWREIIQDLPDSFNQLRTWTANYQTARNIRKNRNNHKLVEWRDFCEVIDNLPYSELINC